MIENPYAGSGAAEIWGKGLLFGLTGPPFSPGDAPPYELTETDQGVFDEGRLAGEQAAVDGLDVFPACVMTDLDVTPEVVEAGHFVLWGLEALHVVWELGSKAFAGATSGGLLLLIEIGCSGHDFESPQQVLSQGGDLLMERAGEMGRGPADFYVGAGQDLDAADCQLAITRLFRTIDQARAAVSATGRAQWVIGHWRTDRCGGLEIVEAQALE